VHERGGSAAHHLGDIDNLVANAEGVATVNIRLAGVTLGSGAANDILGRALVVHAGPDDYASQPAGNSGPRVGCGVIEMAM
jgi:superoxide dismutase, Cu-Zn family